jgi:cytochrome P450
MPRLRLDLGELVRDPFATFEKGRAVGWLADTDTGAVSVLRYEHARQLLTDGRLRANAREFLHAFGVTSGPFYEWMCLSPLNRDGADHQRFRDLMMRTFTPRSVERLRPFLRDAAHGLIDAFAARGRCELMAEFADTYPSLGLCELIGVPGQDRDTFRSWTNTVGLGFNGIDLQARIGEVDAALTRLLAYTGELAQRRRAEPRDDLVSRIARAADEDGGFSNAEVAAFLAGLVFAGHDTTKHQLGWMVVVLAGHRDLWDAIAAGSQEAAPVVEEVMRYRSAATSVFRTVAEPVELDGETLAAGQQLFVSLWSADHDESVFSRPASFDPDANGKHPHVAFGYGPHHCIGAALARAELQEALSAMTARIQCPTVLEGLAFNPPLGINGPDRLPIAFELR